MAEPTDKPVVCPLLVGRAAEVEVLERAVGGISGGRGRTILITGEAGLGKSRLASEAKVQAARLGFLTLEGQCFEPDRACPYAPLLDLLRMRFAGRPADDLARELGGTAPEIARLLPELTALLPGLVPSAALDPEPEKRRLFQALLHCLTGLVAARPTLIVVEDLHWSDDTSLEFLLFLARRLVPYPILLLLTYRSEEVNPGLSHFLAELDRGRLATELCLRRLGLADVEAMLRAIFALDRPVRADFVQALYGLTEGNPFFVEEALTSLIASGDLYLVAGRWGRKELPELRIPRSVQDAVRRRSARLSEAAHRVLALAAVAGRRFDFALLQTLTQHDEPALLALIKELIGAQLVVEASAEHYAFRHALTRQAVYAELLARERRALHRQIAETLERSQGAALDPPLADLAYHYHAAGVWEKTLAYAERAGERARALYAPRAAVEQYTRALEAAHELAMAPPAALHRGRGLAYETLGDFARAQSDLEEALARATAGGDREAEWQGLLDLGFLWASRDYARTGDYFRRALDMARAMDAPATLARSLNRLGNWHVNVEEPLDGQRLHEEALAIFCGLEERRGTAETLDLLALAHLERGDLGQSAAFYQQAVVLLRDLDDRQGLASGLAVLASRGLGYVLDSAIVPAPLPAETVHEAELAVTLAREIGWRAGEAYALCVLGGCLSTRGDFARGLGHVEAGLAIAEEIEHRQWMTAGHCTLGALYLDLMALPAAQQHLERALTLARETGSRIWVSITTGLLATAYLRQRMLPQATRLLDAALSQIDLVQTLGQRLCWLAYAELALARGDPVRAQAITDRLIACIPDIASDRVIPHLWHLRAEALVALQQAADAEAVLLGAAEAAMATGRRPLLWRIQLALSTLYRDQARREAAERASQAAHAIVRDLAADIPDGALREEFLRHANAVLPSLPSLTPRQAAKRAFGGLTARERDVAVLIAQGKTNRAIAEDLVISERTVEGHVANILAKLGFATRTQIAAWSVAQGLVGSGE